jgi:predicted site-specific integrase-resolvase
MTDLEKFVPIDGVAKHFMVSVSTARAWVRQGYIPADTYLKIGNTYRFHLAKVVEALTSKSPEKPIVVPEKEGKNPQQLELDFGNPDDDI